MSNPSIGSYTFITAEDSRKRIGKKIIDITPPGVSGHSYRESGERGQPYAVKTTRDKNGASAAKTELDNYKDEIGSLVTYTDDTGQAHASQMVLDVDGPVPKYIGCPVGGIEGGDHLVEAVWILQDNNV